MEGIDKKRARLNCIHHLLQQVPYQEVPHDPIMLPDREHKPDYSRHLFEAFSAGANRSGSTGRKCR